MATRNIATVRDVKRGFPDLVERVNALEEHVARLSGQGSGPQQMERREAVTDLSDTRKAVSDGKRKSSR